jgi:polycystin 1L2
MFYFRYTFVIERWLSLETTVDAHVTAIPSERPVQFESRFFFQTRDRLSESHMWVSIFYRPQISSFTRVQRASCALVYIFLTMIANAMYFNPNPEYESPPLVQVGPLRFTSQQVWRSFYSIHRRTMRIIKSFF